MPTVLLLAYYFPPLGMGGTQRPAKLAKYLPEFGWTPVVTTVKEVSYYARDPDLLAEIQHVEVIRTGSLDPQRVLFKLRRDDEVSPGLARGGPATGLKQLFIPDNKVLWLPFALARALRIVRDRRIDLLFTTSPPHSAHLGGWVSKRVTGIPWVADFRDPWAGGEFQPAGAWRYSIEAKLQRLVLRAADAVVAVTEGLAENLRSQLGESAGKVRVIPNGFDEQDFAAPPTGRAGTFTFTLCGALTATQGLQTLLAAVVQMANQPEAAGQDWCLRLVGSVIDPEAARWVDEALQSGRVEKVGYRPHRQAVAEMMSADALIYIVPDGASRGHIPGKTFEYLRAGKPVLAIGPEVEGTQLLRQHLPVILSDSIDVEATCRALNALRARGGPPAPVGRSIECYSRRHQAARMAAIFEELRR